MFYGRNREIESEILNNNANMHVLIDPDPAEITEMEQTIVNLAKEVYNIYFFRTEF